MIETSPAPSAPELVPQQGSRGFVPLILLLALTAVAIALRLWRLDLIPFSYDSAAALERTRDTLNLGYPPPTGIINSMGFRNPPGLIWLLLPAGLVSPWPQVTTAWQGLLVLTGVAPVYWFARRRLSGVAWLVPVVLYLFLPVMVMGGRNIWAQNILPALGAWALWGAGWALDGAATAVRRARYAAFCLGVLALAMLVHPASALWLIMMAVWFFVLARRRFLSLATLLRGVAASAIPAALALLPSALDWWAQRGAPPEAQPEFARKFAANMPAPDPFWERIRLSLASVFEPMASGGPLGGLGYELTAQQRLYSQTLDFLLLALVGIGTALAAWEIARWIARVSRREAAPSTHCQECLLLVWLTLPALAGGAMVSYPNGTYFMIGIPALFLLAGVPVSRLEESGWRRTAHGVAAAVLLIGAVGYGAQHVVCMRIVDRTDVIQGNYYISLKIQRQMACRLAQQGVGIGRLAHLSGPWYERSLSYLLSACLGEIRAKNPGAFPPSVRFAVVDDIALRASKPARVEWLRANADFFVGTLGAKVFDDDLAEKAFIHEYQRR